MLFPFFITFFATFLVLFFVFFMILKSKYILRKKYDKLSEDIINLSTQNQVQEVKNKFLQDNQDELQRKIEGTQKELMEVQAKLSSSETLLQSKSEEFEESVSKIEKSVEKNEALQNEINALKQENAQLNEQKNGLVEKLKSQKDEIVQMQEKAHLEFEKIANQILEEKSGKFTETNKSNIESLLKPLSENIESFKKKVDETYDKESKERFSLGESVKKLVEQTDKVSIEANNLVHALKGESKKQGDWGEMILESILQQSGLVKNREYFVQQTFKDENNNNSLRPDITIELPDKRIIIIDSKVSLVAYERFVNTDNPDQQAVYLNEHIKSITAHINNLHSKNYDNLDNTLDFVMMFIPIEPAYLAAMQHDQTLWSTAYSKRILLISPTNLIACLKLISDLWKKDQQSKNAMEIVKRGELLYEKFVNFIGTMEDVGKHIEKVQGSYNTAVNQLNKGSGNLVGQAMKLKNLGLKSSKEIPQTMVSFDSEEADILELEE